MGRIMVIFLVIIQLTKLFQTLKKIKNAFSFKGALRAQSSRRGQFASYDLGSGFWLNYISLKMRCYGNTIHRRVVYDIPN